MSAQKDQFYKCEICGNIVSVVFAGGGDLVCCGQNMNKLDAKGLAEEGKEKHVPVVAVNGEIVTVKIWENPHPMEESHYIMLVQLLSGEQVIAEKRLFQNEEPMATFCGIKNIVNLKARIYCNLHGVWES